MGRSASPFKGFVHKCDRMQSLQCLRWQVVQSSGDVSDSAFIHTAPFVPDFVSVPLSWAAPKYKSQRMPAPFRDILFASFLSAGTLGIHVRDVIVEKTKQNYSAEQLLMVTHYSSLPFTALLFWPSPLSLPSFTFFSHSLSLFFFFARSLMFPVSFLVEKDEGANTTPKPRLKTQEIPRFSVSSWNFA